MGSARTGSLFTFLISILALTIGSAQLALAFTDPPDQGTFTLQVPRLAVSSDGLPPGGEPGSAGTEPRLLAQASAGGGAPAAPAQGESLFGRPPLRQGSWEVGAIAAFSVSGAGGPNIRTGPNQSAVVRAWWLLPRVGYTFWETPWWPGSFQVYLEPAAAYITAPSQTYILGVNIIVRHTLLVWRRFSPYIEGGAGLLNTNLRLAKALDETIEFMPQGGVGFHLHVAERLSLNVGYRFHHISNAGLGEKNGGINSHFPYIGFTHFF